MMNRLFEITYEDESYFDMAMFFSVDDKLRTGGALTITIEKETGKASAVVVGNDESNEEIFYTSSFDVPLHWAAVIAKETIKAWK